MTRALIVLLVLTSAVGAQPAAVTRVPPPFKDGRLAGVLSFVAPGMGQVYSNHSLKGVLIFAVTAASIAIETTPKHCDPYLSTCTSQKRSNGIGYIIGGVSWLYGILSAGSDVDDWNALVLRRVQGGVYGLAPRPSGATQRGSPTRP